MIIITLLALSGCSKQPQGHGQPQSHPQEKLQPQGQVQSQSQPQGQPQTDIYFPKGSNGSQWEYGVRYSTPEGVQMGGMLIQISGEETINGKTYYKQITITKGIPGAGAHVSYNRRAKEGIYKIDDNTITRQEYLTTPFPMKVGTMWTAKTSQGHTQFKAEKIETVELNDKKYVNCLKVSFLTDKGSQHFEGISYFAPGIGEVYSLLNLGKVKVDYALVRYKL
jgi:hypothetical protein